MEMSKNLILAIACSMFSLANAKEIVSFSNVSFKSVYYSIDSSVAKLFFKDVFVKGNLKSVIVNIEAVSIELRLELKKGEFIYTTLDIFNAPVDLFDSLWLKPERVVVIVRDEHDMKMWKEFLAKVKRKQEAERKRTTDPIRVYPPIAVD